MTLQPEFLSAAIELVLGCRPDPDLVEDLAHTLDDPAEVLPWLMLRQGALADDPAILDHLHTLAATANRAASPRPRGPVVPPETQTIDRMLEETMRELIADTVARSDLTDEIGHLLHRRNATPGYEFRRRIVEEAPEHFDMYTKISSPRA